MYRIKSKIVEELKEQDLNVIDLLQAYVKKRTKPKIVGEEAWKSLDERNMKSIEATKEIIAGNYDDENTQLAINTLQALEKTRKEIDEHKNHVSY